MANKLQKTPQQLTLRRRKKLESQNISKTVQYRANVKINHK